jgi:hypothetical protein
LTAGSTSLSNTFSSSKAFGSPSVFPVEISLQSPPTISHKVSRKKSVEAYKITFEIEWDPLAFIKEQEYREEPGEAIERAITLTGYAKDAQALTCAQYLRQTWPLARHTIGLWHCILEDFTRNI